MNVVKPQLPTLEIMAQKLNMKPSGKTLTKELKDRTVQFIFDDTANHNLREAIVTYPDKRQVTKAYSGSVAGLHINKSEIEKNGKMSVSQWFIPKDKRYISQHRVNHDGDSFVPQTTFTDFSMVQGKPRLVFEPDVPKNAKNVEVSTSFKYDKNSKPIPVIVYSDNSVNLGKRPVEFRAVEVVE